MKCPLDESVVQKIVLREFDERESNKVFEILCQYGERKHHFEKLRVWLAAIKLANGKTPELERQIKIACVDFRDVLYAAESPRQYRLGFVGLEQLSVSDLTQIQLSDQQEYDRWVLEG